MNLNVPEKYGKVFFFLSLFFSLKVFYFPTQEVRAWEYLIPALLEKNWRGDALEYLPP